MKKSSLSKFIDVYHLGGQIESVGWHSTAGVLSTDFVSANKNMIGSVITTGDAIPCDDMSVGIYTTSQLKKMLNVLSSEISINPKVADDKVIALGLTDGDINVRFMLADMTVIPRVPTMKNLPDFELSIALTPEFASKFIRSASALSEATTFTVQTTEEAATVVINHANINTNTISLAVESNAHANIDDLTFSSELFTEMLRANSKFTDSSFELSSEGLARIKFVTDEYEVVYYLVSQSLE